MVIILHYIHISNCEIVHLKLIQYYKYASYILIKLGTNEGETIGHLFRIERLVKTDAKLH